SLGAGLGYATEQSRQRLIDDIEARGAPSERDVAQYRLLQTQATQANVALAVGGGLIAAGAAMLIFDALDGAEDAGPEVALVPWAGATPGVGLVLRVAR
ncbi:MAG: hypothetical protein D6729_05905, partial [Deltaproteobacteria bacterium]